MSNFLRTMELSLLIEELLEPHVDRLTDVAHRLGDLEIRFQQSRPNEFQDVDDIDIRLVNIEARIGGIEDRFENIQRQLEVLENRVAADT